MFLQKKLGQSVNSVCWLVVSNFFYGAKLASGQPLRGGKKSHILWWITFCKDEKLLAFVKRLFSREKKSCNNFTPYFSKVLNKHSKIDGKVTKTTIYIFCSAFNFSFWNRICVALSLRYFWDLFKNAELKMRVETILKESCNFQKAAEVIGGLYILPTLA